MRPLLIMFLAALLVLGANASAAAEWTVSGSYCKYTGKIRSVYGRDNGMKLVFLEEPVSPTCLSENGGPLAATKNAAVEVVVADEAAERYFIAALLTAFSAGSEVVLLLQSPSGAYYHLGYAAINRFWLNNNN